ncbi:MAG TPA: enoyl-ACP reductase FabI [Candidatus Stackebrandtia faecavium]|nr:enoyl-ACP reductase FabI [Candidatus Stackebrandtia faecavium]
MSGLLDGKRLLITGLITESSLAFAVAKLAIEQGATVVLTGYGRMSLVERIAKKLPQTPPVIELDVTNEQQLETLPQRVAEHVDGLDGILHSIAFAPQSALGGGFMTAPWEDVSQALHVSTYSFASLAKACLPMLTPGAGIVGMDFDARQAWPVYDWMGVAKAGLESATRYLARDLGPSGVRVNLVAAGPQRTMAAKSIPGFAQFEEAWKDRAPLGWSLTDSTPVAKAVVALLSDWFPATTGEIVHVDGGFHAVGVATAEP